VTQGFQEFLAMEVGSRLGVPVVFVVEISYDGCLDDRNDVCFVCSLPYVEFQRRGLDIAVPVAAGGAGGRTRAAAQRHSR
jgi:hypothetical protein